MWGWVNKAALAHFSMCEKKNFLQNLAFYQKSFSATTATVAQIVALNVSKQKVQRRGRTHEFNECKCTRYSIGNAFEYNMCLSGEGNTEELAQFLPPPPSVIFFFFAKHALSLFCTD